MTASQKDASEKRSLGQQIEFWTRSTVYAVSAVGAFLTATFVVAPVAIITGNRELATDSVRILLRNVVGPLVGVTLDIEGAEYLAPSINNGKRVLLANHIASLDVLTMGSIFPSRSYVMAKHSLAYAPVLGWFLSIAGHFFVRRRDHIAEANLDASVAEQEHAKAMLTMNEIKDRMNKESVGLLVFPEGTRSHSITPDLLPFKKGAFRLAVETQSPIVPIVFANYSYLYNSKERKFKSGTIKVRVLPPIETKGMGPEDVDALIRRTVEVMDKTYKEISLPLSRL